MHEITQGHIRWVDWVRRYCWDAALSENDRMLMTICADVLVWYNSQFISLQFSDVFLPITWSRFAISHRATVSRFSVCKAEWCCQETSVWNNMHRSSLQRASLKSRHRTSYILAWKQLDALALELLPWVHRQGITVYWFWSSQNVQFFSNLLSDWERSKV